jgi:ATP phosphoribosyltransferase regulatory subunit
MSQALASWGFEHVETPIVERLDTLEAAAVGNLGSETFRLVDSDGPMLALRPEMTVAIARLVSTRLGTEGAPHRLRYSGRVFREQPSMRGDSREFTQVGVELVGGGGPAADAEIIACLADTLAATGLERYTIAVGTVAVLKGLIEVADMDREWEAAILEAAHDRNIVAIGELAGREGVPAEVADAIRAVAGLRGGSEAIAACRDLAGRWVGDVLDDLESTWELLRLQGCEHRVSIDFGIMRSFDYYTGVVIEAYGSGPGLPLGGGGRYDGVLEAFGSPAPAAGFALRVERLHEELAAHDVDIPVDRVDALVAGEPREALPAAARLRSAGWRVRISEVRTAAAVREQALESGALSALIAGEGGLSRVDEDGELVPLDRDEPSPSETQDGGAR